MRQVFQSTKSGLFHRAGGSWEAIGYIVTPRKGETGFASKNSNINNNDTQMYYGFNSMFWSGSFHTPFKLIYIPWGNQ